MREPTATAELLCLSLSVAVPLWIDEHRRAPLETVLNEARGHVDTLASQGDIILYRSGKRGETARAFNAMACSIAALAFCPGGITIFGLHFEAVHPDS